MRFVDLRPKLKVVPYVAQKANIKVDMVCQSCFPVATLSGGASLPGALEVSVPPFIIPLSATSLTKDPLK